MVLKSSKIALIFTVFSFLIMLACFPGNTSAMPPVQKMVLPNGLVILLIEEHSLPFTTMQLLIDAGSSKDPQDKEGLAYLTARCLLLGTQKKGAVQISQELDFIGASLYTLPDRDYITMNLRVLKKDLDKGFGLFMETFAQPVFPDEEIKQEVKKTLAAIQSSEDNPGQVAAKEFRKALFRNSPYGHPVEGTKESLPGLTRDMILEFYRTYYHPNNAILAIVGDVTIDDVKTRVIPHLEKLPAGRAYKSPFNITYAKGPETLKFDRSITQANIVIGNPGVSRSNPDFYAISVMNYILGQGGFASRLFEEVRNKRGLAYSIASFFQTGKYPGSFQIVLQTKNTSAREAIDLTRKEIKRIREEPVSEKELEGAKKYLIGSFPLRLDSQAKLAGFVIQSE